MGAAAIEADVRGRGAQPGGVLRAAQGDVGGRPAGGRGGGAMSETSGTKSLVTKLAEVMALVHRVPKRGRNEFHKYDYATEADIVEAVRGGLAERGVLLVP